MDLFVALGFRLSPELRNACSTNKRKLEFAYERPEIVGISFPLLIFRQILALTKHLLCAVLIFAKSEINAEQHLLRNAGMGSDNDLLLKSHLCCDSRNTGQDVVCES